MLEFKYDTQLLIEGENLDEDKISEYFTNNFNGDCLLAVEMKNWLKFISLNEPWKSARILFATRRNLRYCYWRYGQTSKRIKRIKSDLLSRKIRILEVLKIKSFLENVRAPEKYSTKQADNRNRIILFGFTWCLAEMAGWYNCKCFSSDNTATGYPQLFWMLAIWILLATIISVYAKSPLRAAINTFFFFISMLAGYYLYCNYIWGSCRKPMMIWIWFLCYILYGIYVGMQREVLLQYSYQA